MNVTFKSSLLSRKARLVVTEEMIRHVALELVRLGREVPEASWFKGAEEYAVALVRRLVEIARDEQPQDQGSCLWCGRNLHPLLRFKNKST